MKPVEQTQFGFPGGNCFAACMASVLELSLDAVPNFESVKWFHEWNEWLRPRNLSLMTFSIRPHDEWKPDGVALLGAKSLRGDWLHSVVILDGEIVWDPHPERALGVGAWMDYTVFQVLDPSRARGEG